MSKRRRRAFDSDESAEEIEQPFVRRTRLSRRLNHLVDSNDDKDEQDEQDGPPDPDQSGKEGQASDGDQTFPIKLKLGKRRDHDEDDEYHEDESSPPVSSSAEEYSELSNDGFVVDSDDNVVSRRRSRRRRGRSSRLRPRHAPLRTSRRLRSRPRSPSMSESEASIRQELRELRSPSPMRIERELRARQPVNYEIRPAPTLEEIARQTSTGQAAFAKKSRQVGPIRRLFAVNGPFGGNDVVSIFNPKKEGIKDVIAETAEPIAAARDLETNVIGGSTTADADPLGIDTEIDFSSVGGLDDYVDRLKEMVSLPLMYPDIYKRFGITPPRGVLFHGPPGTGKTLMARALASSCSHDGKKITFFMRKGADCLSKWIGEAERQLRVLFEEAKAKQPSIIFFDEIDGLAPVRSSKQEQIHASIVSTLLALMDGMDNRGQVVVIGATNRPDSIDPALRRPGRFDREFYFPLPDKAARAKILEIQTRKWDPPLESSFIDRVAGLTKGYGGADLRALCTESALNAIQRRYPQIYKSSQKLLIEPESINVTPQDFIKSMERIVPSSVRGSASDSKPIPPRVEPLLEKSFKDIKTKLTTLFPTSKPMSALEEAQHESGDDYGFEHQQRLNDFKAARTHRPRLLVYGEQGMGQEYIGPAILNFLEGVTSQIIDLGALFGDPMRTPEASLVQILTEAKKSQPCVILIPSVETLFAAVSAQLQATFFTMLKALSPADKVLLVAIASEDVTEIDPRLVQFFGISSTGSALLKVDTRPEALKEFFTSLRSYILSVPTQLMEVRDRPPRKLEQLPLAPQTPSARSNDPETDEKSQEKKDLRTRSQLKVKLGVLMDSFKNRYRRFRKPVIDDMLLLHLFEGIDTDQEYEYLRTDDDMIVETVSGKKYYNMDLDTVEDRLWNGFYCEPKQFLEDLELIHADSLVQGDRDRVHKSSEMMANAQVAIDEINDAAFLQACRDLRRREAQRQLRTMEEQENPTCPVVSETLNGELREEPASPVVTDTVDGELREKGNPTSVGVTDSLNGEDVSMPDLQDNPQEELLRDQVPLNDSVFEVPLAGLDTSTGPLDKGLVETTEENLVSKSNGEVKSDEREVEVTEITPIDRQPLVIDQERVSVFFDRLIVMCQSFNLDQLEIIYSALADVVWKHRTDWDRSSMLDALDTQLDSFANIIE